MYIIYATNNKIPQIAFYIVLWVIIHLNVILEQSSKYISKPQISQIAF